MHSMKDALKKFGSSLYNGAIVSSINSELSTAWNQNHQSVRKLQMLKKVCRQMSELFHNKPKEAMKKKSKLT